MEKKLIFISGATGAGKTVLLNFLKNEYELYVPRHITTRAPRKDDSNFYDYISKSKFLLLEKEEKFLISSGDGERYYGIYKEEILNKNQKKIILNCSYKDIEAILNFDYPTLIIVLTFKNLEERITCSLNKRNFTREEIKSRVLEAIKDHKKYFNLLKRDNCEIFYVDTSTFYEIYAIIKSKVNLFLRK